MNTNEFGTAHETLVSEDLHQLLLRGRRLHDQAIFEAFSHFWGGSRQLFRKIFSTATCDSSLKFQQNREASLR